MLIWPKKYKQMKEQGVRQDDPEYIKAHQILVAVQKQRQFQAQQQAQQQAHQRQSTQQQSNTPLNANGVNGTPELYSCYIHTVTAFRASVKYIWESYPLH